jgi:hypothetical protein
VSRSTDPKGVEDHLGGRGDGGLGEVFVAGDADGDLLEWPQGVGDLLDA